MKNNPSCDTNRKNLLQLLCLRIIAIFGQLLTIFFVEHFLEIELPLQPMIAVIAMLILLNCFGFYRYQKNKNISDKALFFELIFDVAALTAQLYFSGGISNPFISLFLLQVIIAAILLHPLYAWIIAVITTSCYVWLSFYYQEFHAFHDHGDKESFNLHLHGMLISYVVAAILLLIFITKISKNLRQQQEFLRSAMLATAAAHDLGTPLNTISVILEDWKNIDLKNSEDDFRKDILLIESQIKRCKTAVSDILSNSKTARVEEANSDFLNK